MDTIEEQTQDNETAELAAPDELTVLKQRAKMMGISHSPNIGVEALRAKIQAKMEEGTKTAPDAVVVDPMPGTPAAKAKTLRQKVVEENMKLVRLRITNLDPKKKDLPGEIITVANRYLGTVRKYVPFGEVTEDGYHVPWVIYQLLKERKFLQIRVRKVQGKELIETNYVPEFALEVLPPLTRAELNKLATAQKAAGNS